MYSRNNVVEKIKEKYGGTLWYSKKGLARLKICNEKAYLLLLDILPYSIVKKEEIELAIKYYEHKQSLKDVKGHFSEDSKNIFRNYKNKFQMEFGQKHEHRNTYLLEPKEEHR